MIIKSLECTGFDVLIICFLKSFENYYVEMPTDKEYFRKRWQAAKVNFNLSYGMFDDDKLVGFIINAIVNDRGTLKAYNVGTGVLPEYRGRKIVRSIYNYALRDLKRDGIKNCSLEVIKDNIIAIKAYRSIGFEIVKNYKCYAGAIKSYFTEYIDLRETNYTNIACKRLPNQELYTWDNQLEVIRHGNYKYYIILNKYVVESFFVIDIESGYIPQFDVIEKKEKSWFRLFGGIKSVSKTIKINNVNEVLGDKIEYINYVGLENTIDQYEMELVI